MSSYFPPEENGSVAHSPWLRGFTIAAYILTGVIILLLFAENFVFSDNLGLLGFREVDDVAFQTTLRRIHTLIQSGHLRGIWTLNDYAYGWIYWAPLALITYPLYWLSTHMGVDWPLIVLPRQSSLLFAVLSLLVLRKLLKRMHAPEWACAGSVLIYALFPTWGYFSMRFGTVNAGMFFSILSVYLAHKDNPSTVKGRAFIALSLAMAGGIKLSGLLIAPMVGALVIRGLWGSTFKQWLLALVPATGLFLVCLVTFTNPALWVAPFYPGFGIAYWQILSHFLNVTKIATGGLDPVERFQAGVFGSLTNKLACGLLLLGLVITSLKNRLARFEGIAVLATLGIAVIYLISAVKNVSGLGCYFTAVSFLLLLGTATGYAHLKKGVWAIVLIAGMLLADTVSRGLTEYQSMLTQTPWNHFSYFNKGAYAQKDIKTATAVEQLIKQSYAEGQPRHIFVDFTAPVLVNALRYPNTCVSIAWDNLSAAGKYCGTPIDYIILDKKDAVGALPNPAFKKKLAEADPKVAAGYIQDRASRQHLNTAGTFAGQTFKAIGDFGRLRVFKAISTISSDTPQ